MLVFPMMIKIIVNMTFDVDDDDYSELTRWWWWCDDDTIVDGDDVKSYKQQ